MLATQQIINAEILQSYEGASTQLAGLPYSDLLMQPEWKILRKKILEKKNYTCNCCKKRATYYNFDYHEKRARYFYAQDDSEVFEKEKQEQVILHIHHKYYINKRLPWQYIKTCFEVLCKHCHFNFHKENEVPYLIEQNNTLIQVNNMTACTRCCGAGHLPQYHYYHNGICFKCMGAKYNELIQPIFMC